MDYILKQISPCVGDPLIIPLNSDTIEIGRSAIPKLGQYSQVSRHHARISKINHEWIIEDLNSMNGVFVEQKKVEQGERIKLKVGDTIGFGVPNIGESAGFVCIFMVTLKKVKTEPIVVVTLSDDESECTNNAPVSDVSKENNNSTTLNNSIPPQTSIVTLSDEENKCTNHTPVNATNQINDTSRSVMSNSISSSKHTPLLNVGTSKHLHSSSNDLTSFQMPSASTKSKFSTLVDSENNKGENESNKFLNHANYFKDTVISKSSSLSKIPFFTNINTVKHDKFTKFPSSNENILIDRPTSNTSVFSMLPPSSQENIVEKSTSPNISSQSLSNENTLKTNQNASQSSSLSEQFTEMNNATVLDDNLRSDDPKLFKDCVVRLKRIDCDLLHKVVKSSKRDHRSSLKEKASKKQKKDNREDVTNKINKTVGNSGVDNMKEELRRINSKRKLKRSVEEESHVAVSKPIPNKSNDDLCSFSDLGDDDIGYSQAEEVICLSDDDNESYLDFNSSQPITTEPLEEEDEDFSILNELPDENDIEIEYDSASNSESIETICNFMKTAEIASVNIKIEKLDPTESIVENFPKINEPSASTSNRPSVGTSCIPPVRIGNNEPSLSLSNEPIISTREEPPVKNFSEHSDNENSDDNSEFDIVYKTGKHFYYKKKTKTIDSSIILDKFRDKNKLSSSGKAKLTEPKPMGYRPRYIRGREEWFEPTEKKESPKKLPSTEIPISSKKLKSFSSNLSSTGSSKSRSSIGKTVSKKIDPRKLYLEKKEKLKMIELKKLEQASSSTISAFKKPAPPVKKRNDNFGSRSQFLTTLPTESGIKPHTTKDVKNKSFGNTSTSIAINEAHKGPSDIVVPPTSSSHSVLKSSLDSNLTAHTNIPKDLNSNLSYKKGSSSEEQRNSMNIISDPRLNRNSHSLNKATNQVRDKVSGIIPKWGQDKNMNKFPNMVPSSFSKEKAKSTNKPASTVPSSGSSNPSNILPSNTLISFESILEKVLSINIKWILEQKKQSLPPPYISVGAVDLPFWFESYEHYITVFQPMLMLEIWEEICREAQPILENHKLLNKFYFIVRSCKTSNGFIVYECESMINEKSPKPLEGTLVILEIKDGDKKASLHPILGYIKSHFVVRTLKEEEKAEWREVKKYWTDGASLWKFSISTKIRNLTPLLNHIMKGNVIFSIKNKLRLAEALRKFRDSPLHKCILKPDRKVCTVNYSHASHSREYSPNQKIVIDGICREIIKPRQESKMILLQGPPGTGKTHTIVGLLESLIFNNPSIKKILVVAPSNAAIDEIGCRLIDLNDKISYKKTEIKFVRIGLDKNMNANMKPYSLDVKADAFYRDEIRKSKKYRTQELEKKEKEIKKLKDEVKMYPSYTKKQTIDSLIQQCIKIKEKIASQTGFQMKHQQIKLNVLKDSNVILSTLGSCCQSVMMSAFQKHLITFSACIIDEATQCTEIDVLQPLIFNISKLILVGDHNQLPATVSSQYALRKCFDRSMFERFYTYFSSETQNSGLPNPVFMLTEQYRMHSEICSFPSRIFYDRRLITVPDNDISSKRFPVYPYVVYDILDSQEINCLSSKTNDTEARAVASICSELIRLESNATIGIITPYQAQVKLYRDTFYHNPSYKNIEINTVDSFQGREKDIIIVSCVRANSASGGIGFLFCRKRLNVAITRARHCLIICVHSGTLEIYDYWKDLINDARKRGLFATVPTYKDVPHIFYETLRKKE